MLPLDTYFVEIINTSTRGKINNELRRLVLVNLMTYDTRQLDNFLRRSAFDVEILKTGSNNIRLILDMKIGKYTLPEFSFLLSLHRFAVSHCWCYAGSFLIGP